MTAYRNWRRDWNKNTLQCRHTSNRSNQEIALGGQLWASIRPQRKPAFRQILTTEILTPHCPTQPHSPMGKQIQSKVWHSPSRQNLTQHNLQVLLSFENEERGSFAEGRGVHVIFPCTKNLRGVFRWFEPWSIHYVQCMVVRITYRHQKAKSVNASLKVFYLFNFGHV